MEIKIDRQRNGRHVLDILRGELSFSSSAITFLKNRENGITVNGEHATVRRLLAYGDVLEINYADIESSSAESIVPVDLPLDIIHSDRDIIIVNKPPYMPTHPSRDHQHDTLANALAYHFRNMKTPFVFRAVNRLDSQTSGLVIVARNKISAQRMSEDIARGHVKKNYFAVLHGKMEPSEGSIDLPIRRAEESKILRKVSDDGARSLTKYKTVVANEMYSAVIAAPITGRTHQLRVHFSHSDHAICGDTLYGYPCYYIDRQALHAYSLTFPHPSSGEPVHVTAPLPKDIRYLCENVFSPAHHQILQKYY